MNKMNVLVQKEIIYVAAATFELQIFPTSATILRNPFSIHPFRLPFPKDKTIRDTVEHYSDKTECVRD